MTWIVTFVQWYPKSRNPSEIRVSSNTVSCRTPFQWGSNLLWDNPTSQVGPKWKSAGANQSCFFWGFQKHQCLPVAGFKPKNATNFWRSTPRKKSSIIPYIPNCLADAKVNFEKKTSSKAILGRGHAESVGSSGRFRTFLRLKKTMKNWRSQPANHGRLTQFLLDPNTVGWWLHIFQQIA